MKKQLVWYDPDTHKPSVWATITLDGDKVVFEPKDAPKMHTMLKSMVVGGRIVKPTDGPEYFEALDRLRGTYYEVKTVK